MFDELLYMLFLPVARFNKTHLKMNRTASLRCVLKTMNINPFEIYFNRDEIVNVLDKQKIALRSDLSDNTKIQNLSASSFCNSD